MERTVRFDREELDKLIERSSAFEAGSDNSLPDERNRREPEYERVYQGRNYKKKENMSFHSEFSEFD